MQKFPSAEFSERTHCINCASANLTELSRGRFTDQPLFGFIEADPWGESPVPYLKNAEWILVQCFSCGQVFHKRVLTDAWNEKRFSTWMSAEAIREYEARVARTSPLGCKRLSLREPVKKLYTSCVSKNSQDLLEIVVSYCVYSISAAARASFYLRADPLDSKPAALTAPYHGLTILLWRFSLLLMI